MPIFSKEGKTVLYIHIPKTGGTSIERLFESNGWTMTRHNARGGDQDQHAIFRLWSGWPEVRHRQVDTIFTVIRDPQARLRSHMRGQFPWAQRPDGKFYDMEDYESFMHSYLTKAAIDPGFRDNHIRPQSDFLPPLVDASEPVVLPPGQPAQAAGAFMGDGETPLHLFYFENPEHRSQIQDLFGLEGEFPHFTGHDDKIGKTEFCHAALSPPLQYLCQRFYMDDYRLIEYNGWGA